MQRWEGLVGVSLLLGIACGEVSRGQTDSNATPLGQYVDHNAASAASFSRLADPMPRPDGSRRVSWSGEATFIHPEDSTARYRSFLPPRRFVPFGYSGPGVQLRAKQSDWLGLQTYGTGYGLGWSRNEFGNYGQGYGTGYSPNFFGNYGHHYGAGYSPKY